MSGEAYTGGVRGSGPDVLPAASAEDESGQDSAPEVEPGAGDLPTYLRVLGLSVLALGALGAIHLFIYLTEKHVYPTGWDAPTAVLRANTVIDSGIARFGAIRAGAPLLVAVLHGSTPLNTYTVITLLPAVLMWVGGSGVAGLVRASFDVRPIWLPVFAFLTWAAFGENGMLNIHLDNLLNAALILPALAAAAAFVRWRRGYVAFGVLAAAAVVAHWPFYAFTVAVLLTTLALFLVLSYRDGPQAFAGARRSAIPLLGATFASALVGGSTFLARGDAGWIGARLSELRAQLRYRFMVSLHQAKTYVPYPTALLGMVAALSLPESRTPSRRFFLCLMAGWFAVTALGALAQAGGFPTAGARELHFFFPASILTGLFVWWLSRRIVSTPSPLRTAAAALVLCAVVGSAAWFAVAMRSDDRPWFNRDAVAETAAASAYVASMPGAEPVVFIFEPKANVERPSWLVVRSTLRQSQLPRAFPYYGSVTDYLAGTRTRPNGNPQPVPPAGFGDGGAKPIVFVLRHYAPTGFRTVSASEPDRLIAPGVSLLRGPMPAVPLVPPKPPTADGRAPHLAVAGLGVAALLLLAGSGWAWALLPPDPIVRVSIAPGLGLATVILASLAWAWVRLPLRGGWGAAPLVIAAVLGWLAAAGRRRFRRAGSRAGH